MLSLFFLSATETTSQTSNRTDVPIEYTWDLTDLYASDEAWESAKDAWAGQLDELTTFKGSLSSSAGQLLACLDYFSGLNQELRRLYSYASNKSNEDTRNSEYIAKRQEMRQLVTRLSTLSSYIEPEIVAMEKRTIDAFLE